MLTTKLQLNLPIGIKHNVQLMGNANSFAGIWSSKSLNSQWITKVTLGSLLCDHTSKTIQCNPSDSS